MLKSEFDSGDDLVKANIEVPKIDLSGIGKQISDLSVEVRDLKSQILSVSSSVFAMKFDDTDIKRKIDMATSMLGRIQGIIARNQAILINGIRARPAGAGGVDTKEIKELIFKADEIQQERMETMMRNISRLG